MVYSQPGRPAPRKFEARFDSECEACYGPIEEGDMIAYLEGDERPSCEECVDDAG